jgi:hypothetical protein
MKKQARLQPQPRGGPPMFGLALFFLSSSSAFLDELIDHESRSKTVWSACVTTRLLFVVIFSLILYITGIRIGFFF